MLKFLSKSVGQLFGTKQEKDIKYYTPLVEECNEQFEKLKSLSHEDLRDKTRSFKEFIQEELKEYREEMDRLQKEAEQTEHIPEKEALFKEIDEVVLNRNEALEDVLMKILPEAFAVVKETARRFTENDSISVKALEHDRNLAASKDYILIDGDKATWKTKWTAAGGEVDWKMVHYDVQLIGGMVLHEGKIAEMATGEGKTLVATLPAYLNALAEEGVHVITVNDYLARRDAEWIGPIMEFLLLTVDCIDKYRPHSPQRRQAYSADITYGTNNEFGFDYLRDNMVLSTAEKVQRPLHYTMIDEVDSVLIDDARTPLIISGPVAQGSEIQEYEALRPKIEGLVSEQRKLATKFLAEAKKLIAEGSTGYNEGEGGMALLRAFHALPKSRPLIKFLSEEGIKVLLQKAENFYMQEQSKNMHLVDDELFFIIDEKNRSVELTENGAEFLARGNEDSNFFIMPDIALETMQIEDDDSLSDEEKDEKKDRLVQDYSVKSKRIHSTNQLLKAYTLFEKDQEYVVIDGQVKIVDEQTGRVMEGRRYSDGLHQALEAKEKVKVGDITQTYATVTLQNYFRMYHKLCGMTGTAETEAGEFWEIYELDVVVIPTNKPIVRKDEEDLVFKTQREKFNAVIDHIQELSEQGRPILVGTTSVEVSEKLSRMLNLRKVKHNVLNAKQHQREAQVVAEAGKAGNVTIATNMAGRGTDIKINDEVKENGGLAIIGTERHDSRRVDRQLRGRSGRQGDPGSSQFFVSLEDSLMRLFNSERIAKLMDRMGHKEGEVIQHSMVSKSIERAQKKVEENNFGIRKRLLEYDDIMNIQRDAIYKKRKNALSGERLSVDLYQMFQGRMDGIVFETKADDDYESFQSEMLRLGVNHEVDERIFLKYDANKLADVVMEKVMAEYKQKGERMVRVLLPVIKRVYEKEGHKYKRIAIPFTDGSSKSINISADLKAAVDSKGETITRDIEKAVTLALIDDNWKEHLRSMDELKDSVQSASFEQKDPLVIYKMEAYNLFEALIYKINSEVTSFLLGGYLALDMEEPNIREAREQKTDTSKMSTNKREEENRAMQKAAASAGGGGAKKPETFVREGEKVGRNDPCPCGSGKKYKKCHGKAG
ncbi:MAG TPA: preprotein translocase subunit SecA [Saprospiraceae bacterium]|nr:preprotein translocase subunit SecA [Saprospiraceae bacterium]